MCQEFEAFLAEYRKRCHATADELADILEGELIGIYGTGHDIEGWDEFRALLRSGTSFRTKFDRYSELIRSLQPEPIGTRSNSGCNFGG
jgi:hypothetical protein